MENPGFSRWDSLVAPGTDSRATLLREPRSWSLLRESTSFPACLSLVRPSGATLPLARERRATGHPGASCFAMASLAYLVRPSGLPGELGLPGPCFASLAYLVPVWSVRPFAGLPWSLASL